MPDEWERLAFGSIAYTGDEDPDNDGWSNTFEYHAQTDPVDASDHPVADGDVNVDGFLTVEDAVLALRYAVGDLEMDAQGRAHGDIAPVTVSGQTWTIAGDGSVSIGDVMFLLRAAVGSGNWEGMAQVP